MFDIETEEWICDSFDIKYNNQKPSEALRDYTRKKHGIKKRYEKNKLPNYALKIQKN